MEDAGLINNKIGVAVGLVVIGIGYLYVKKKRSKPLPPSPFFKLPILGHLPYILLNSTRLTTHLFYSRLADRYGELSYLKVGNKDVVVVSSPEMVKEFFINNAKIFSARPQSAVRDMFTPVDFIFDYGLLWRFHRKLAYRTLLLPRLLSHTESFISREIQSTLEWITKNGEELFSPHAILKRASMSIISQLVFGMRFDDPADPTFLELMQCYDDFFEYSRGNIADYLAIGKYIPNKGIEILKRAASVRNNFFNLMIQSHLSSLNQGEEAKDYLDALLLEKKEAEEQSDGERVNMITNDALIGVCHDIFAAGTDTTSTTLEWLLLYLATNPEVQSTLQSHLDDHFGTERGRMISYKEAAEVEYVHAIINETLRKGSIAPHMVPHMSLDDCFIDNRFYIPKHAIIIPNVYHINNDKKVWGEDVKTFNPERFLSERAKLSVGWGSSSNSEQSNEGNLLSFGVGPRQCVGLKLAKMELLMFVANLCWNFTFKQEEKIDDKTQLYGVTLQPNPYRVIAISRNT